MGVQALPPLPPAACIMALDESYLPPHAPCVMAASGLCPPAHSSLALAPHTVTERGGGQRPLGGAPRTPYTVTPAWRVVEPAGERSHLTRPPVPPPPRLGRRGPHVRFEPASPLFRYTGSAGRQECGGAPHCPKRPPPHQLALKA